LAAKSNLVDYVAQYSYNMSATDSVSNILNPETEIKTDIRTKIFPKQKYNRNLKEPTYNT